MKIGVYLSSKDHLPSSYVEAAQQVGSFIGSEGRSEEHTSELQSP